MRRVPVLVTYHMTSETLPEFNSAQAFEVASVAEVKDEVFGPVLQIVALGQRRTQEP